MFGEFYLSLDPLNFNTESEYLAYHFPELYEEIKELQDNEEFVEENVD